jgi:hypothetical protein
MTSHSELPFPIFFINFSMTLGRWLPGIAKMVPAIRELEDSVTVDDNVNDAGKMLLGLGVVCNLVVFALHAEDVAA